MNDPRRKRIGGYSTLGSRAAVYEGPDGLEIDATDHATVSRQRVLFEDVILITRHHEVGTAYVVTNALLAAVCLTVAAFALAFRGFTMATVSGLLSLPFLALIAIRLAIGIDVVTVFGRRSKTVMRFAGKAKGAETYGRLCATVRSAQRKLAEEMAALEPAAEVGESPPMPEEEMPPMPAADADAEAIPPRPAERGEGVEGG